MADNSKDTGGQSLQEEYCQKWQDLVKKYGGKEDLIPEQARKEFCAMVEAKRGEVFREIREGTGPCGEGFLNKLAHLCAAMGSVRH